jgi:carbamoyl-phosphate synthase large subunit
MENIDAVGIHTGDSMVVAPSQTLSDKDYQRLRNVSLKLVRALKITGGCNVQLALDAHSDQYYIIEVNPRVSRSSALASKATGYPIAKIAAKIALGFNLDEIKNPITQNTYACFEPALDYVVFKMPRWPFDKFVKADSSLSSQMMATGESMAIGRHFNEALLKAVRSCELGFSHPPFEKDYQVDKAKLRKADHNRLYEIFHALRQGITVTELNELTFIDFWFLTQMKTIVELENKLENETLNKELLTTAKKMGFTDQTISEITKTKLKDIHQLRAQHKLYPVYKMVDTCAGEFESSTPYYYSTYAQEDEVIESQKESVVVLGSGPIRIGQGVEFDYATVHAVKAIQEMGLEAIVINSNPATVSTDFDLADKLYFEPLDEEDVLNIIRKENPKGVLVQFGGQTAINLAESLKEHDITILGTSFEDVSRAEDRKLFEDLLEELDVARPLGTSIQSKEELHQAAEKLDYPLMLRPSFVIGGRAMEIVYDQDELNQYLATHFPMKDLPKILVDKYLVGLEVEVDALYDGKQLLIPGIMEHIERTGVHSGDSYAVYPPQSLSKEAKDELIRITKELCHKLNIIGLLNLQFIVKKDMVYVIEVNPRASRTLPFLSKVTSIPMAKVATKLCLGQSLKQLGYQDEYKEEAKLVSIKAPVFSFHKIQDVDSALGPEMKSTGEAIGIGNTLEKALKKAFTATGMKIPSYGKLLITIADKHKEETLPIIKGYYQSGFSLYATSGTARFLQDNGLQVQEISKIGDGDFDISKLIKSGEIDIVINTLTKGRDVSSHGSIIRRAATSNGVICLTSIDTAKALLRTIEYEASPLYPLNNEDFR